MGQGFLNMKMKFLNIKNMSVGIKASIVYTLASLFSKGLAIITVPIFTRIMSTDQIGVVNLFSSWQSMIGAIATLALTSGGYMVAMKEYSEERNQYMSSVLTLTSLVALLIACIYYISPTFWNDMMGLSGTLMKLMIISFFISPAMDFWLARQRYEYKYKTAGLITMGCALCASVCSVIAVIVASQHGLSELGEVRLVANYIIMLGVTGVLWMLIMLRGKTFINVEYWKFSLTLSLPLIGNSFAMQILNVSDRTMIGKMVGNSAVGIYSVLYTVSSISLIVWGAINSSYVPFLFENIEKKNSSQQIKKTSFEIIAMYALVALIMTLIAPEIVRVLATEEYYEAIYIMPPIAAGVFLTSVSNMYSNILIYYKKTSYIMLASGIAASLNVILNYFGISLFGYFAAAYTTLIAYVLLAVVQAFVAKRMYKSIPNNKENVYDDKKIFYLSIVTIGACLFCLILYKNNCIRYLSIGAMLLFGVWIGKNKLNYR